MTNKTSRAKFLRSFGIEESLYAKIRPSIEDNNHKTVTIAIWVCIAVFAVLGTCVNFGLVTGSPTVVYVALTISCIALAACEHFLRSRFETCSTVVFYITLFIIASYGFMGGIFNAPNDLAVTICLLLCIAPSILVDRPWRIILVMVFICVSFCVCATMFKPLSVATVDYTNILSATALGLAVGIQTTKIRINGYVDDYAKSRMAKLDGLTGILNKNSFVEEATCLMAAGVTGALLVIDADKFKHVNDVYGHAVGDEVIKAIADSVANSMRGNDVAGRFGGDEFCVLLTGDIPPDTPENYFNRMRVAFQEATQSISNDAGLPLTLSCGAVLVDKGTSYEKAFEIADAAMYEAKQAGGNRIITK